MRNSRAKVVVSVFSDKSTLIFYIPIAFFINKRVVMAVLGHNRDHLSNQPWIDAPSLTKDTEELPSNRWRHPECVMSNDPADLDHVGPSFALFGVG